MDTSAASNPNSTESANGEADTSARIHDVFFTTSKRCWFFNNAHSGITLASDHIAWTVDNKIDSAWYKSIVAIRLQTGGSWMKPIGICEITFADGYRLIVTNANG